MRPGDATAEDYWTCIVLLLAIIGIAFLHGCAAPSSRVEVETITITGSGTRELDACVQRAATLPETKACRCAVLGWCSQ